MTLRRWNYETRRYEPYAVDPKWFVISYAEWVVGGDSVDVRPVNCTSCGRAITYGDGYTSLEIHNLVGLGFTVCEICYDLELKRRSEAKKRA